MFKTILAFIKTHIVATAITTTVVVGTAVATPIVVEQIEHNKAENEKKNNVAKVDQMVNDNLDLLIKKDEVIIEENQIIEDNHVSNNNQEEDNIPVTKRDEVVNKNEPLTFRIKKVTTNQGTGSITMEGETTNSTDSTGTAYRIVPSYDKDPSEWTDADKEAYMEAVEEIAKRAKADYDEAIKREEQIMREMEEQIQQMIEQ